MKEETTVIYSKPDCIWCNRLKEFCNRKGITFYEIVIGVDITTEFFKSEHPGVRTVPAVFIDKKYIGGYKEFVEKHGEKL